MDLLKGNTLFLFCKSVIVWRDIFSDKSLWALQLTTDIGIFVQFTNDGSSISPSSKRPSIRRSTCLSTSSSVINPLDMASGSF